MILLLIPFLLSFIEITSTADTAALAATKCHVQSDCGRTSLICENSRCVEKVGTVFPLSSREIYASVGAMIAGIVSSGSGLGGGGLLVPLYMLTMQLPPREAIPLSKSAVFGASVSSFIVNMRKRHPTISTRPLIDVETVVLMEPMTLAGTIIGVNLGEVFPQYLVTLLLLWLFGTTCLRTLRKGLQLWKQEMTTEKELIESIVDYWQLLSYKKKSDNFRIMAFVYIKWKQLKKKIDHKGIVGKKHVDQKNVQDKSSSDDEEIDSLIQKDADDYETPIFRDKSRNLDQKWSRYDILLLLLTWSVLVAFALMRGGHGKQSIIAIRCGSASYWALNVATTLFFVAITLYFAMRAMHRHTALTSYRQKYAKGDMIWNRRALFRYPVLSTVAGIAAGLLGIGGGMIKGPLLLEMGLLPQVVSATSSTMILFTSSATVTQFIILGTLPMQRALWHGAIGFIAGIIGQYGLSYIVKKYRKTAVVVLLVASVIGTSGIAMGILSSIHVYQHGLESFKSLCEAGA